MILFTVQYTALRNGGRGGEGRGGEGRVYPYPIIKLRLSLSEIVHTIKNSRRSSEVLGYEGNVNVPVNDPHLDNRKVSNTISFRESVCCRIESNLNSCM